MSVYLVELGALNVRVGSSAVRAPLSTLLNRAVWFPYSSPLEDSPYLFGEEADFLQPAYPAISPVSGGRVAHWPSMLALLENLFLRMGLGPDPHALPFDRSERKMQLITGLEHPASDFERICSFVFEKKFVDELSFSPAPVNALYYSGNVTGLVLDAGHDAVRVLPVIEGFSDLRWMRRSEFAGAAISQAITTGLRGVDEELLCRESVLQHIKQTHSAFLADSELQKQNLHRCKLPDGSTVPIRTELVEAFDSFYGLGMHTSAGILGSMLGCLDRFDRNTKANLALKIFPTGGSACLTGFDATLAKELSARSRLKFEFVGNDDRLQAAYKGSHDLMELRSAINPFISRKEFEESGMQIILKKVKFR